MKTTSHRTKVLGAISALSILVIALHSAVAGLPADLANAAANTHFAECEDGIDNDHDNLVDYPEDPKCHSLDDEIEGPAGRGLFISVTDGKQVVNPSGSLTYILSLRTERDDPVVTDVFFQMPHQTNLIGVSDNADRQGDRIVWKNISVFKDAVRNLRVTVEVDPDAKDGLLIVGEMVANGQKDTDTTKVEDEDDGIVSRTSLKLSITDGVTYAKAHEILNYVIAVRNPTDKERDFDLRFQIPTDTRVEFVSGENHTSNRQAVVWEDQKIGPLGVREYAVSVRIDKDVHEFQMIRTRASSDAAVATDTTTVYKGILPNGVIVTVTDGLEQIVPGAIVTYDIGLQNLTNQLATEVDVINALPNYLEFVDASEGGYWTGKNIRWQGLTVAPEGTRALRVTGRVRSDAPAGQVLKNTVSSEGFESVDTTTVGHSIVGRGLATQDDIAVYKHADRSEVHPGETIHYTVSVRNTTRNVLRNVRVSDRMDSPYIRVVGAEHGHLTDNGVEWTIPVLEPGKEWTVRYSAKVDLRAPHGVSIPNIVTVTGEGMNTVSLTQRIHTMNIGVISNLPPTGAAFDALFLALTGVLGAFQTLTQRKRLLQFA